MQTPPPLSNFDRLVFDRRSIRKYKKAQPSPSDIAKLLTCASQAPSPSNTQPLCFLNICSQETRDQLFQTLTEGYQRLCQRHACRKAPKKLKNRINYYWRFSRFIAHAPTLFAVGCDDKGHNNITSQMVEAGLLAQDLRGATDIDITIGIAITHFILKAHEIGLATCIVTAPFLFASDLENILGQSDISLKCFITLGYADETPAPPLKKSGADLYREI